MRAVIENNKIKHFLSDGIEYPQEDGIKIVEFDKSLMDEVEGYEFSFDGTNIVKTKIEIQGPKEPTQEELHKQELYKELNELESWFIYYDNQCSQYQRCIRLGVEFDKDINELDNKAKENAVRIKEIRLELGINQ